MKILKNILSQLHRYIVWALILSILWCLVYSRVGDRPAEKKVVFYSGAYACNGAELAHELEDRGLPEGIEMVQVRGASYDLFGFNKDGDLYLVREPDLLAMLEAVPDRLAAIELPEGMEGFAWEGKLLGIRVFDPGTQKGPAMSYIQYTPLPDPETEAYYLCFDAASLHLKSNENAIDNAAWELAMEFLEMDHE